MKNTSLYIGLFGLILGQTTATLAGEAEATFERGVKTHHQGVVDVVTSPEHMVEDPLKGVSDDHPFAGTAKGVVSGTTKTGEQVIGGAGHMVEGTGEILEAPIEAVIE